MCVIMLFVELLLDTTYVPVTVTLIFFPHQTPNLHTPTGGDNSTLYTTHNSYHWMDTTIPVVTKGVLKEKVDIITLQDTRLDDKDSQLIAMLIRNHFDNCNIQIRIAPAQLRSREWIE